MVRVLARLWIKDYQNLSSPAVQSAYARLCSGVGIVINLVLFLLKFGGGAFCGSAAMIADGFNNLADAGTAVFSFFGFVIAGTGAGKRHPFGHGRYEWLMSVFSSLAVVMMGITLARNSLGVIHSPAGVQLNVPICVLLFCSILAKLYMYLYNRQIGGEIHSSAVKAAASDSISDMAATSAILFTLIAQQLTGLQLDGWCGLLVSVFIIFSGLKPLGETVERLLGRAVDADIYEKILTLAQSEAGIFSISDLAIHDYGLGHVVVSMHLEGTQEEQRPRLNEIAHGIAYRFYSEMECDTTVQVDILDDSEKTSAKITHIAAQVFRKLDVKAVLEEYRAVEAGNGMDITLTVAFPRCLQKHERAIRLALEEAIGSLDSRYRVITHFRIVSLPKKSKLLHFWKLYGGHAGGVVKEKERMSGK